MARQLFDFGPPARFYECPRWRDGRWWVSDMRGDVVYSLSAEGEPRVELNVERPAGLGWTPDGHLLVVSMDDMRLLRVSPTGAVETTFDLAGLAGETVGFLNDMVVTPDGHAYVGFDADFNRYADDTELGLILHVDPAGRARVAARDLAFPNGLVITPDGSTLVVAETMKPRLTSFALGADGALGDRKVWGSLGPRRDARPTPHPPLGEAKVSLDGCAMDAEGHVWAADVRSACLRVAPGGAIVDAVFLPERMRPFACALGGPDGRTLMICGADDDYRDRASRLSSQLYVTRVDVAAAGAD